MTEQEYQIRFQNLVDKVRRMRGWQKERDKVRFLPRDDHARMKRLEREVDNILSEEKQKEKSKQKELF